MPSYRAHRTINLTALAGLAYGASGRVEPLLLAVGAASYVAAAVFLSPDLDLKHSSPTRNWGPLRWLWRPYQAVFKHRGLSHNLLVSSATRIAYLLGLAVGGMALARVALGDAAFAADASALLPPLLQHRLLLAAVATGIFLSDATHIAADRIGSALKALVQ